MPRRKRTKCNQTVPALKINKCSAEKYNKQKGNVSVQRFSKSKTHLNQWNYVKYTGYKSTHEENEKEKEDEEDPFGLSPAYLCECTLPQDTSIAPEDPSKEYCVEKGTLQSKLLKRKEQPSNDKAIKRNDLNNYNQKYSPSFLCESILQAEDTSVALGPDHSTDSNSKNSLLQNNLLKKKKQQHNNKNVNHSEFNNQGQGFSSGHLYGSKLKCNDTFMVSDPDLSNAYCSKKRLLESNPLNKRKSQQISKKIKINEENNHINEYSPAFLCESIIPSEESTGISKYDPSKENCSTNSLLERNPRNKTKPQCRSKKLKNNKINNKSQNYSSEDLSKNTAQSGCTLGVSESGPSKTYCFENSFLKINSQYKKNTQCSVNVFKNKDITITLANPNKSTFKSKDTPMLSKFDPSKEHSSENKLLEYHPQDTKKPQRTSKRQKKNEIKIKDQEYSSANLYNDTLQCEDFSVISNPAPKKGRGSKTRLLQNKPLKNKKPQHNKKDLKTAAVRNQILEYNHAFPCENTLNTEDNLIVLEPGSLRNPKKSFLEKNLLKKEVKSSEEVKNNEIINHPEEHSPLQLFESTIQSEHTSVLSEPNTLTKFCSKNKIFKSHPQDIKKPQRTSKRQKKNKINIKAQEYSSVNLCNDVLQSEGLSVISKSDHIKRRYSKTKVIKYNLLKQKKPQHNKKELKSDVVSNHISEYNHAFPCERTLSSEGTLLVSKSGSLRKSKKRNFESNLLKKKEQQNNIEEIKSNEILNHPQEHSPLRLFESTLQSEDGSVLSKSNPSKKCCSENKLLESHSQGTKKPRLTSKRQKNNEKNKTFQEYSPVNFYNGTPQFEDFSVISKPGSLKLRCSKTRLLKSPLKKKKLKHNNEEVNTNVISNSIPEYNHATIVQCESTFDSEGTLVVSNSLRKSCFENNFLENNPLKMKELQNDSKELKSNENTNHLQEHGTLPLCENTLQSQEPAVVSKSDPLKEDSSKNRLPLCENTLQSQEPAVVSKSDPLKEDCSKSRLSEINPWKKKEPLFNDENNEVKNNEIGAALKDESISQAELISCASESDPLIECSPKNRLLEKYPLNHEGQLHSDTSVISSEVTKHNQGSSTEEISFIECNLFDLESKHSDSAMEVDPLEWNSTVSDKLKCNQKDVDLKEINPLETDITQNSIKVRNFSNESNIGSIECDLNLECILEDTEPLEPDFRDNDCNSEGSDVLGSISSSFDIKITQLPEEFSISNFELIYDSGIIPTSLQNIKVTSETVKNDREYESKIEPKHVENMDEIKLLENNSGKINSMICEITFNQIKVDYENLSAESSEDQTKETHSLQCVDSKSNLQDLGESSTKEEKEKTDSIVDNKITSEVSDVLEQIMTVVELSDFPLSGKLNPKDEPTESCPLKMKPEEVTYCSHKDNQSLLPSLLIKYDSGNDCKMENYENHTFSHLTGKSSGESYGRASSEMLPTSGFIKDSKEGLNFHQERVLKVLLRRLEDEEVFKVWKKDGVISLLKHSSSKTTLGWKQTRSLGSNIQKSLKKRKNYKCWVCKKSFKNRERYWQHRASKCDSVRVFGCGNCNRTYILKKMLDEHRTKCISVKYFRCKVCLKLFNSQERLDEHNASKCDTEKAFHCDVCERSFIFKRLLLIHKTPICTSLRRYKCSICHQSFDQIDLKTHKLKEHGIGILPTVLCEFCGKLVNRKHFSDHMYIHFGNPLYRCKDCSELFQNKEARRHHEQYHLDTDTKPCICADCGKAFKRLDHLKKHVSGHGNFNKCNTCGKVILNQFCFRVHVKSHVKVEDRSEEVLKCEIKQEPCDEDYSQCINDENDECEEICTERITMESNLQSVPHTPLHVHGSENKTEQYQDSLKDETKPFKCDRCSSCFLRKKYLNQHMRKKHNALYEVKPVPEDKPFKCETCGSSFLKRVNLNRHCRRVHKAPAFVREIVKTPTEEKPYACNICRTCFRDKRNLSNHRSRVHRVNTGNLMNPHLSSGNLLYPCAFCDEKFKTNADFKEHTFEHFKNCFSVTTNVKEEEILCANSDVKIMRNDVKTATKGCSMTTNVKEEGKLFLSPDVQTVRSDVQTLIQRCSVTTNVNEEEKRFSSSDVKTVRNDVQTPTPPTQSCSVTTNINEEDKLFSSSDVKAMINDVQTTTQERPYVCDICGNRFGGKRNLTRHRSRMHSISPLHPCSFCNEKFKTDADLKDHTFEHFKNGFSVDTNVKVKENMFIRTGVFSDSNLQQPEEDSHLKQQEEASTSIDNKEEEVVISSDGLDESLNRLGHLENDPSNSNDDKSKGYACRECGKTFNTRYSQKRHICLHKLSALQSTIGRDVHACEECGVIFFEKWRLNTHLLSHSSLSFRCDICKKCFTSQLKLSVHMLVHGVKTSAEPTFECSTCNKLFPSSKKLENHMILHTEQNPYQCTKCNRKFTTPFSLKRHNDNIHVEKRFLCNYCNMSFVSFSSLNQHVMYVHKKAVSLTEYVLKIDDDLPDQTPTEADYLADNNLQDEGTAEVNLPAQVFANIGNMFMYSNLFRDTPLQSEKQSGFRQDAVKTNDMSGLSGEKEAPSPLEFTIRIADR